MFLLLCILAMFAIHAITQIASKTEKLWSAKKHHHNFAFWRGMLCEESGEGGASGTALTGQGILSLSLLSPLRGGKIRLCPLAVIRSRFGFAISRSRTAAACLSRCFRHRRRSKAKPLRGSRGGAARRDSLLDTSVPFPYKNVPRPAAHISFAACGGKT